MAGAVTALFFWANPELKPLEIHEGILGLLVHVPVLVVVSLLTSDPAQARARGDTLATFASFQALVAYLKQALPTTPYSHPEPEPGTCAPA